LKEGRLKAVVATSSLDLGVDFLPVERVLQIGSAKGVARLLQRAGRSGHAHGRPSRITLVPTHTLELVEATAARRAAPLLDGSLFAEGELLHDVLASLNSTELARRRFREIARVAGLIFTGYPGAPKSTRQLQASSSLFYEVFRKYDASNLLLSQAQAEVLSQELDIHRLAATLKRMRGHRIEAVMLKVPSPFALPLMVERFREKLTTEKLNDRLARILRDAERADRSSCHLLKHGPAGI
jgi:Lhr-like helicase